MFFSFTKAFLENLISEEFRLVEGLSASYELSEETKYIGLMKSIGNIIYIVFIVNINELGMENYKNFIVDYKNKVAERYENLQTANIILLPTLFCNENASDVIQFTKTELDLVFENDNLHLFHWVVDGEAKTIFVPKDQPSEILNIKTLIHHSLSETKQAGYFESKKSLELSNIAMDAVEKSSLEVKSKNSIALYVLMLFHFFVFAFLELNGGSTNTDVLIRFGAIEPNLILGNKEFFRLFTYMFLHIGIMHLLSNTFALYIFGVRVLKYYGTRKFLFIYFTCGLLAGVSSLIFTHQISAGASGAIMGLLGAMVALSQIKRKSIDDLSFYTILIMAVAYIAFDFLMRNVDNAGHLGGLISGYIIGALYAKFSKEA